MSDVRLPTREEFSAQVEASYQRGYGDAKESPEVVQFQADMAALYARTDITPRQKRQLAKRATQEVRARLKVLDRDIASSQHRRDVIGKFLDAVRECQAWIEASAFALQQPQSSAMHKLVDTIRRGDVCFLKKDDEIVDAFSKEALRNLADAQAFLIQHDWASAFTGATDFDAGEVKLPYESCTFDFQVAGHRIIVLATQADEAANVRAEYFLEMAATWIHIGESDSDHEDEADAASASARLFDSLWAQIRAVSIALDAEAAQSEIIRAPHKLNRAREKRGVAPLVDFHIVTLSQRARHKLLDNPQPGTRKRLHFRRGHWRHYPAHKTWIKWMLVGNPDLGFIDKEYRL